MIWTIAFRTTVLLLLATTVGLLLFLAFPGIQSGAGFAAVAAAPPGTPSPVIAPADVVTIVLTAATLVLGAVAIIISALAFIGFEQTKRMVEAKASSIANERLDAHIKSMQQEVLEARGLDDATGVDRMAAALAGPPPSRPAIDKGARE